MGEVVLITGVGSYLGSRLAAALTHDADVERIVGLDLVPPAPVERELLGRTEFVRADLRSPQIARVVRTAKVTTVVHVALTSSPRRAGGRAAMQERNVIGTMQLLAACQKAPTVRRVVVKSSTAVYGASPRDPAVFAEDTEPVGPIRSGFARDAVEVESYVRSFARRRPDVTNTVLRFAHFIGPQVDSPLARYLSLPLVPVGLGHDPRLQMLHEADAVEVLRRATRSATSQVVNVAGTGVLLLSQAIRRAGRIPVPLPAVGGDAVRRLVRRQGWVDFTLDQARLLTTGRVVDTTRLSETFGYRPAFTTEQALEAFVTGAGLRPVVAPRSLRRAEAIADAAVGTVSGLLGTAAAVLATVDAVRASTGRQEAS